MAEDQQQRSVAELPLGVPIIAAYVLVILSPAIAAVLAGGGVGSFVLELGKLFGLAGSAIILMQVVLAARIKPFCRHYGLDMVLRFHRLMAIAGVVMLVLHPVLVAWGKGYWELLYSPSAAWQIWLGKIGLAVLVAHVCVAFIGPRRFGYERWRSLHDLSAEIIIAAVLIHGWYTGSDLYELPVQIIWFCLGTAAVGSYVHLKLIRPRLSRRWRVASVSPESHNAWTLAFEPVDGEPAPGFLPGQFHFLRFRGEGGPVPGEEHPFTISSSPANDRLTSTIKASGDFTAAIAKANPGDEALIDGPHGRFSYVLHPSERDLVFISGGVGITPFISMLRHMRDTGADLAVTLIAADRTVGDVLFGEELDEIALGEFPRLNVVRVLSRPEDGWQGERGHVDGSMIARHCGEDLSGKSFWICGPPLMMHSVATELRSLGVAAERVHTERFSL